MLLVGRGGGSRYFLSPPQRAPAGRGRGRRREVNMKSEEKMGNIYIYIYERKVRTSINILQCHLLPKVNRDRSVPSASIPSRRICSKLTIALSSSPPPPPPPPPRVIALCPAISTETSTQPSSPSTIISPPSFSFSSSSLLFREEAAAVVAAGGEGSTLVFPTSARTPTIASVPSEKHIRALPLAEGMSEVSARRGRKDVGVRASGRMGGRRERELWR